MHVPIKCIQFKFLFLIIVVRRYTKQVKISEVKLGSQDSLAHNLYFITEFQT